MPFRKYSNQFRKGVCQLTCDCGHSQSQQTYPYEQPPVQTYYQQQSITAEAEKSVPWDVADTLDISTDDLPF